MRRSEDCVILIDYAHNEMSLKIFWKCCAGLSRGVLLYCSGAAATGRKLRRSKMGRDGGTSGGFYDTDFRQPALEDPETILDDIEDGIQGTGGQYVRIADGGSRAVCHGASHGEYLCLCLGKRARAYQEIRGVRYPLSEYELVEEARRSLTWENTDRNEVDRWRNMRR